ncbi:protein RESPONSE TO ABA AND SALT 1 [Beta vulgaris subsp. vulgaris]|uniref:protein RESPONSE TO ABA AND SALT 1 n=1 Tax=Beta vulgaris subsp. vulgaris TaxID=3555 RepID=UPI00203687B4|nr:protein RESPONSE TO ABA AND SALT 1 [Beta vulgaris subsp. vulgaris]
MKRRLNSFGKMFSPPWLSSLEKSLLWMGGFKPSITFSLVEFSVSDMVPEQVEKLIRLKKETKIEERTLMDALAAVQEAMGSPPLINLVKQYGRLVNGEVSDFAEAIDETKHSLSSLVHSADNLRRNTVMKKNVFFKVWIFLSQTY